MNQIHAHAMPEWQLFISDEISATTAETISSFTDTLVLPSGKTAKGIPVDFSEGFADIHSITGTAFPAHTNAIFLGKIVADEDCTMLFGAGCDWWWTCFANGEIAYSRGEEFQDGNRLTTLKNTDWIFPVKLHKGDNVIALHLVSGVKWTVSAGLFDIPVDYAYTAPEEAGDTVFAGIKLVGDTTKPALGYKVGEEIEFRFDLFDDRGADHGQFLLIWSARGDDGHSSSGCTPISVREPVFVRTTLNRPGYVNVTARVAAPGNCESLHGPDIEFNGGAGAAVGEIRAAVAKPDDFDSYWAAQRAKLDAVPLKPEVEEYLGRFFHDGTKIPDSLRMFTVKIPCAGPNPVTGFLAVPKEKGKYAACVVFDGYSKDPKQSHRLMTEGVITFHVNAHGYDLFRCQAYYDNFFKPFEKKFPLYGISPEENANPDTAYFHGMALRVMRSFDFIKTLPEWNGRDLFARGGSQGGLQAIWAASLVPELTRCICHINWCSNIASTKIEGRLGGWLPEYVRGLDYYDTVFHASRIPATCFVDVVRMGLGDYTCPPSGITAMYNAIKGPKRLAAYQNSTHMYVPQEQAVYRFNGELK